MYGRESFSNISIPKRSLRYFFPLGSELVYRFKVYMHWQLKKKRFLSANYRIRCENKKWYDSDDQLNLEEN